MGVTFVEAHLRRACLTANRELNAVAVGIRFFHTMHGAQNVVSAAYARYAVADVLCLALQRCLIVHVHQRAAAALPGVRAFGRTSVRRGFQYLIQFSTREFSGALGYVCAHTLARQCARHKHGHSVETRHAFHFCAGAGYRKFNIISKIFFHTYKTAC